MKWEEIKKYGWIILLVVVLIVIDQSAKIIIEQKVAGQNILMIEVNQDSITSIITDVIILSMVTRFMIVQRDKIYKVTQISLSLILGGGIGNLIDKIFKGGVINFIDISSLIPKFPIFNLADIFLIVGFVVFAITVGINLFSLRKGEIEIQDEQANYSN